MYVIRAVIKVIILSKKVMHIKLRYLHLDTCLYFTRNWLLEIDFIANHGSKRYYIQSAFSIPDEEKAKQEKASLINVNDSFKKIVIVKDVIKVQRDENGITTMSVYDFLLNENSLEL